MYINKINLQTDTDIIEGYIASNGFATIISAHGEDFTATHAPLHLKKINGESFLFGHIARPNSQSQHILSGTRVMALFMADHAYISSSWYDHVNVPTWNYIAVHIHGSFIELSEEETITSLHDLVEKYEGNRPNRFEINQMTDHSFKAQLRGITAFKIKVNRIDASWKLSQNRDEKNKLVIIEKLMATSDPLAHKIAEAMGQIV
jgi:transcriptional regulator